MLFAGVITNFYGGMATENFVRRFETVESLNDYLGVKSVNPYVSVINLWDVGSISHMVKYFGLYCVTCVFDEVERAGYSARLYFTEPGQYGHYNSGISPRIKGWILCFHPDLLQGTLLANRMSEYTFFSDIKSMPLYLDSNSASIIDNCMRSILAEIAYPQDCYTKRIVAAGIAVLLTQCLRFYNIQNDDNSIRNSDIVRRVDMLLNTHFSTPDSNKILPNVGWCADQLGLSHNYFGDLMRKYGGCSAQEHLHYRIVEEVKLYLDRESCSIGHIADMMGFKHSHHLSRLFRKVEGCTPMEYRRRAKANK